MNAESFKKLYLPYMPKLYHIAYNYLGNSADAEDMVQDAYLKLWDKREDLVNADNTEAFCVTIIKNMCLDALRSDKYRQLKNTDTVEHLPECSNENEAEVNEQANMVKQLIGRLPDIQRKIVILRDIDGYSFEEIGAILSLNLINVRVQLSRARKKIREQLIEWENG